MAKFQVEVTVTAILEEERDDEERAQRSAYETMSWAMRSARIGN
jgi:hypothetical protein